MGILAIGLILGQVPPSVSFEEKILSTIPEGTVVNDIQFSPDGRQVAYWVKAGNQVYVQVNREKGPVVDAVLDPPRFGPDGRTVYYRARSGGKAFLLWGGRREPAFDQVGVPVLSPDGKKAAYAASNGHAWLVVIGNQRYGGNLHHAGIPLFDRTGSHWAVPVRTGRSEGGLAFTKEYMIVDGRPGPEFDKIEGAAFSPSGVVAYRVRIGINVGVDEQCSMVVGTQRRGNYAFLGPPRFTADGRLVHTAGSGSKRFVVVDGVPGEEFDSVSEPVFSPDGRSIAYVASRGGESFVVVDGRRLEPFPMVQDPVFSPDGRKVAYPAFRDNKWRVVTGDQLGDPFDLVGAPVWSPDSRKTAHAAVWNNLHVMVVGGVRSVPYEFVGPPAWSPDGARAAFVARIRNSLLLVLQFKPGEEVYDEVYGAPVFSPDGRKVALGVRKGRDLIWKVLVVRD